MAVLPAQPQNFVAQQADGNILLTWNGVLNAVSYQIQRSTDGINFSNLATATTPQYVDSYPGIGIQYWYQVAAVNGSGTGVYSLIASSVAAPPSEMSLGELRLRSQQTADRYGSGFVTDAEWNAFLRLAMYELYDLLITEYEDYGIAAPVYIGTNGNTFQYPLPNGANNYLGGTYGGVSGAPAPAFYKLSGVDLQVNSSTVTPSWVTIHNYMWEDRNDFIYPNSTSTIYGVYNMRYRVMGNFLNFIPTPAGNQTVRMWYAPRLPALLLDSDLTTIGVSGWLRYPIVRAAKYALDKEEGADTSKLDTEILFLKTRIEQAASNRDQGQPQRISNVRKNDVFGGFGSGGMSGGQAGW